ncbi:MAG: ABC transporter permease [Muribaculaceae bacterium]|nr:ABC transporter permease [Muribaculaceae bacterium]MDE6754031.1 ABC transporter permease [Muribaculaceae bacterium]
MNYPFFLAKRLSLTSGKTKNAPAVTVAITAVALSIAVMLASIMIVLGFKKEIRDKVVGFNGHITLYSMPVNSDDDNIMTMTPTLKSILDSVPFVNNYSLQAAIPAILKTKNDFKGVYLRGLNGEISTKFIKKNLEEGEVVDFANDENKNSIIISRKAANQLQLKLHDTIDTYFISDDVRVRRLKIAGIYNSHFDQYDDVIIFGALQLVQQLGQIGKDQGTYLQISTDNFDDISNNTLSLQQTLNKALAEGYIYKMYRTDNVLNQGVGFFSWLNLLDTNVVVVLVLMMIVSCVTLISGLLIIILEKKRFIGMIRALGSPIKMTKRVFIYLALKIALIGMIIGNVIMLSLLYMQDKTHFIPLDADSYYIDFVPVSINIPAILYLNIGVLIVTYLVLIFPSGFVSKILPSETMRYE